MIRTLFYYTLGQVLYHNTVCVYRLEGREREEGATDGGHCIDEKLIQSTSAVKIRANQFTVEIALETLGRVADSQHLFITF